MGGKHGSIIYPLMTTLCTAGPIQSQKLRAPGHHQNIFLWYQPHPGPQKVKDRTIVKNLVFLDNCQRIPNTLLAHFPAYPLHAEFITKFDSNFPNDDGQTSLQATTLATKWQYAAIASWSWQNVELGIPKYHIQVLYIVWMCICTYQIYKHSFTLTSTTSLFPQELHLGASLRFLDFEFFLRKKKVDPIAQRNDCPGYLFVWLDVVSIMYIRVWYFITARFLCQNTSSPKAVLMWTISCICMLNSPSFLGVVMILTMLKSQGDSGMWNLQVPKLQPLPIQLPSVKSSEAAKKVH